MEYTKIKTMAYNLHFIKTDKFKRNYFKINFKFPLTKEGITYGNLLSSIMNNSSNKYHKAREIALKLEDLYVAYYSVNNLVLGTDQVLSLTGTVLRDEYTEPGNEEEMIKLLQEIIFHPFIQDEGFDSKTFKITKERLKESIDIQDENPNSYANNRFIEEFFYDSVARYHGPGYIEDLNDVDGKKLYDFYQKILRSSIVDIFICGNVDIKKYEEWFKKYFPINTVKKEQPSPFIKHKKLRKRAKIIRDQRDVKQCILKIGVKFDSLDEYERKYIAPLYAYILGGGSDSLMFSVLREKHSLCYYCSASYNLIKSALTMQAGINYDNIKKSISLIKKLMKEIENGNFDDDKIDKYQIIVRASRKELLDSAPDLIGLYQTKEYFNIDIGKEFENNLSKLTKKMVIDFAKKVKIDTIYTLEGVEHNE